MRRPYTDLSNLPGLGCRFGARCVPLQGVVSISLTGRKIVPLEVFTTWATHASPLHRSIEFTGSGMSRRCPLRFSAGPELTLRRKSNENGCRGETMTVNEIASFCAFKNCRIWVGSPQAGFVEIGGSGVIRPSYTYGRFQMLSEVLPLSAEQVIAAATVFKVQRGDRMRALDRAEFQGELDEFQRKVNS